ncbi:hypothetical protein Vadar_013103 [Vaccinium darrowii]|uniref:Uncharacterized protein n=1 Tax=Vaccinium darrowii TaxID=229202 RepID=A0ACB7ZBF9_9ERIC|nr:hypothetical protein Vadar_013103 [Vaccinium darrowii]
MEKANRRGDKLKWDSCSGTGSTSTTNMSFERDKTSGCTTGYTWPQRNYPCAFCKKQFKSAQALGGHMNVHRRERAQLRSLVHSPNSTLLDHYPNPNPKPSFFAPSLVSLSSPKSSSGCIDEEKNVLKVPHYSQEVDHQRKKLLRNGSFLGFGKLKSFTAQEEEEDDGAMVLKKKEKIDRLELGMGLGLGLGLVGDEKEDLDLELRLGFS